MLCVRGRARVETTRVWLGWAAKERSEGVLKSVGQGSANVSAGGRKPLVVQCGSVFRAESATGKMSRTAKRQSVFCSKPFEYPIMSIVVPSIHELKTRGQFKLERAVKTIATRGLLECLIVSSRVGQREVLSRAATASGWASVVCSDAATARHLAERIVVKLAFVDLEQAPRDELASLQQLAADLSRMGCPLLVVCGADGDAEQEIWARQLGAWLYLPGMGGVEPMTQLCDEARGVVERSMSNSSR
jgi:ActR/RegA family two-component response regulator